MSRLLPVTVAMRRLRKQALPPRCQITEDEAIAWLRRCTGEDFGHDVEAWSQWLKEGNGLWVAGEEVEL